MAAKTIDEYISGFSGKVKDELIKIKNFIKKLAPDATEAMTYGVPTYKLNGKNLIHFAAFKHHFGIYPTPTAIKHFANELKDLETSMGTIKFNFDQKISYALIEKIVKFKINEIKK
jgi:uncharacterized protein YdhG (YjbR/CyaY superfamily)